MVSKGENGDFYIKLCNGKELLAFRIIFNHRKEIEIVCGRKKIIAIYYEE